MTSHPPSDIKGATYGSPYTTLEGVLFHVARNACVFRLGREIRSCFLQLSYYMELTLLCRLDPSVTTVPSLRWKGVLLIQVVRAGSFISHPESLCNLLCTVRYKSFITMNDMSNI